jgi:uncharacterized protein
MLHKGLKIIILTAILGYSSVCLFLFFRQRQLILNPRAELMESPSDERYQIPYEAFWIPVPGAKERLRAWWIPASQRTVSLPSPNEAKLTSPKTLLYLNGRGSNKSFHLPRIEGLWKLGYSILMVDYRGFGESEGDVSSETQLYTDAQVAWNYLGEIRKIPPKQIIIYGESLGGSVAVDLAVKRPTTGGLILQSTFTSMAELLKRDRWLRWFPIDLLLTERFDSIAKVRSLQVPVLILHGEKDSIVPSRMSQRLYDAAPEPKRLLLIPSRGHLSIYQTGEYSYLRAIEEFVAKIEPTKV